jgi:hypothetical protein
MLSDRRERSDCLFQEDKKKSRELTGAPALLPHKEEKGVPIVYYDSAEKQ